MAVNPFPAIDQTIGGLTSILNPVSDLATYLVPKIAPLFGDAIEIRDQPDPSIEPAMPLRDRIKVVEEINTMRQAAGIKHNVIPYAAMTDSFSSYGGRFSLTDPVMKLPTAQLFRTEGLGVFGSETDRERLERDDWRYSDNEMRFLILKEFAHLRQNDKVLKLVARVAIVSALLAFQFFLADWRTLIGMVGGAALLHIAVDRYCNTRNDAKAVRALGSHLKDPVQATQTALRVLKKQQRQNQFYREQSLLSKLLYTTEGDSRFSLTMPSHSKRIAKMENHLEIVQGKKKANYPYEAFLNSF